MKIYLGADHNGFILKEKLEEHLKRVGYDVIDDGGQSLDPDDDYPVFASKVIHDMFASEDSDPRGILICGSGQGMAIAANRFKGIRAVVVDNVSEAKLARNDDDSNVLALPGYLLDEKPEEAFRVVDAWLDTPFESVPRRNRRIEQIDQLS